MPVNPILCFERHPFVVGLDAFQDKTRPHPTGKEIISTGIGFGELKVHPG